MVQEKKNFYIQKKEFDTILKLRKFLYRLNEAEALKFLIDLIKTYPNNEELLENVNFDLK